MAATDTAGPLQAADEKIGIGAFFERAPLVMFGLGYAAGLPNQLAGVALAIWLREAEVSLTLIALLGLATLFYSLKFLWAPVVDRVQIPGLEQWLGRRRSWMLVTQVAVILAVLGMSQFDPLQNVVPLAIFACIVGFAGATQDIAIDAWRIEVVKNENRLGVITATYQWGYRIAILLSGALPLFIAQAVNGEDYAFAGWSLAYLVMAGCMLIAVGATLLAPRELAAPAPRWVAPADIPVRPAAEAVEWAARLGIMVLGACLLATGLSGRAEPTAWLLQGLYGGFDAMKAALEAKPWGVWQQVGYAIVGLGIVAVACRSIPGVRTRPGAYFSSAMGEPLKDFFTRYEGVAMLILLFICFYRISDFLLNLTGVLYLDAGFQKDEIAAAQKFFGAAMSAIGAGFAGWAVLKFGLFRCLIIGSFLQPLSNLCFIAVAMYGAGLPDLVVPLPWGGHWDFDPVLYSAIAIDNVSAMFAGTSLIVYMSRLTRQGFTATQYALFSSLYSLPGKLISAMSGRVVEGAAMATHNGSYQSLAGLFAGLPAEAFAKPAETLGVAPTALATGYVVFFTYTALMGIGAVVLALLIARGRPRALMEADDRTAPAAAVDTGQEAPKPA
jgi:MFS transporter, PAT family, beta-lactamase induction signal transducer AmpG